jgi:hypothetical protein
MDKEDKQQFLEKQEKYIEHHKIRDRFAHLLKQLVIHRPDRPIDYLIDVLEDQRTIRGVFISGLPASLRNDVAFSIQTEFNFKLIDFQEIVKKEIETKSEIGNLLNGAVDYCDQCELLLFCSMAILLSLDNDVRLLELVVEKIKGVEKLYKGYVLSGFPNNLVSDFASS